MWSDTEVYTTQHRECSMCRRLRVWFGPSGRAVRACLHCDAPETPCGPDTATWEINQRRRERGEVV